MCSAIYFILLCKREILVENLVKKYAIRCYILKFGHLNVLVACETMTDIENILP